jgi:hypothetical protein
MYAEGTQQSVQALVRVKKLGVCVAILGLQRGGKGVTETGKIDFF